jgi:hypothetical protein
MRIALTCVVLPLGLVSLGCLGEDVTPATASSGGATDAGAELANRVEFGDFEVQACLGWEKNSATAESDATSHGGKLSCRICAGTEPGVFGVFQVMKGLEPGPYVAEAWLRAPSATAGGSASIVLQNVDGQGSFVGEAAESIVTFAGDWKKVAVSGVAVAGQQLSVGFVARSGGDCFLVDDVTVTKAR